MKLKNDGTCFRIALITVSVAAVMLIALMSGCSVQREPSSEAKLMMTVDIDSEGNTVYNGNEQLFYEVQEGKRATVHFSVEALGGSISFDIQEKDNENMHMYRGVVTEPCEFDVEIGEPKWYRILVTADHFSGSYGIDWKTESTDEP